MAKLRKYQIEAIASEIEHKICSSKTPIQQSEEYITFVKQLTKKINKLIKVREKNQKEVDVISDEIKNSLGLTHLSYFTKNLDHHIKTVANKKFNVSKTNRNDIERAVILSDLNGSNDIIKTVMEKLGYGEN